MTQVGMADQSDERRHQFETEALRIVNAAAKNGLMLRLLGSLAFQFHCPNFGYLQKQLGRAYTDIDYAGYKVQASKMVSLLIPLGYEEDPEVNLLYAGERMIYNNNTLGIHIDIFFDKLNYCHEISWIKRLESDSPTLPLAEMLLEKMQIVKINEKDIIDTIMLLLEHPLGNSDKETINIERITSLCAQDWGLWRTVTMNLGKVRQLGQTYTELGLEKKTRLGLQVETALNKINQEPKTLSWKIRSKVGERVKWYQEVDDVF
jgi:hypothetical protein